MAARAPAGGRAAPVQPLPAAAAVDLDELPDECSEPFFKGIGVVYVEVESDGSEQCDLCEYARRNPAPPSDDPAWDESPSRWGVMHDCMDDVTLCREEDEEEQHAFHAKCLRAFVLGHKSHFRNKQGCPVCDNLISDATADAAAAATAAAKSAAGGKAAGSGGGEEKKHDGGGDDDDLFGDDDDAQPEVVDQLYGKKRNRAKQMYSIWVHVRQATGLKLVKTDKTMNPVAFVTAFGKTVNTAKGDGGKTYNCVWNEAFAFQKMMDEDEFSREVIQIRVEDSTAIFRNTLIGFVKFQAETVHAQPNHEFYQLNYPLVNMASKKKDQSVTMQGQLEVSVCVLSEQDVKDDPTLPRHIYDAEVEMWAELQNKAEVVDFDLDKSYLQNNLNLKKEQDLAATATAFDIVHVRVYRAEDLPKLDSRGWVDAFIELEYKGLMDKGAKLKSKPMLKQANPAWNVEFTLPIVSGAPLIYDAFELVVKNHNSLVADEWIGKCAINISDILKLPQGAPPMWKSLYQDIDGKAPTYRGRVLIELSVETAQKDAKMFCTPCSPCRDALLPPSGSYRLDFELLEGIHLLENYSDYQVDITMGHSMTVGGASDDPRERDKGGKAWATIESDSKNLKGANKTVVPFLTKKSLTVHNLPYPRRADQAVLEQEQEARALAEAAKAKSDSVGEGAAGGLAAAASSTGSTGTVTPQLSAAGTPLGFRGDATELAFNSVLENFNKCTTLLDYKSMMPDVIIYVSKKGGESGRKQCVGYLRIPMNGLKRPTENWEHGEDLTVAPNLWEPTEASARSYALKPLVELYQLTSGFLLFKLTITPVEGAASSSLAAQAATTKLAPVPRQRYRFVANVYQAKDMASVDSSGLSSPFATVQIGDVVARSKPQAMTCNPLWFEALTGEVELPCNLLYAPDFAVTCYHHKSSVFKFNDPSIFMGRADVAASAASTTNDMSEPAWYPLQFEEMQYGNILLSFRLTPLSASSSSSPSSGAAEAVQSGLERMISGWENYAVEISALDIRGKMATKHKVKKIDPTYQLEVWGDIQSYRASSIARDKFTVYLRKPSNPVFYSAVNFRIYEGKELTGVTSVPLNKILRTGVGWYKLMELLLRDEVMTQKRVVRKWRAFIRKKHFVDPRTIRRVQKSSATVDEEGAQGEFKEGEEEDEFASSASRWAPRTDASGASSSPAAPSVGTGVEPATPTVGGRKVNERTALKLASGDQPVYSPTMGGGSDSPTSSGEEAEGVDMDVISLDVNPDAELLSHALKAREVDAEGNEVIDEKDLKPLRYLQAEQMPDVDAGSDFEKHWRLECEYEMLPTVNDPFLDTELFVGKDEIHSTFLDKLFSRGKQSVGRLRGHFYGYRIGALPKPGSARDPALTIPRVNPLFDSEKYFAGMEYCVRVYILRGLQLRCKKGKASGCDPFVSLSIGQGGEVQKSDVLDGTLNPQWYACYDFMRVGLPSLESTLTVSVYNDNTILSADLIGSTEIQLENRLCSKPWQAGQKPIERRALKKGKSGRLPQGFIEVCVQILPMHEAGTRALDYLLSPPKRLPWQMRVILWNCRKVTMKKIYKTDSSQCGCCNCCYDICAPPNQSDIKLIAGMSGSKAAPQATDTHPRSIDGDGMFNYRCVFDLDLPSPKMLCNLKVQVWNINWNPDDCLAEAIIPLWGFFEVARREWEKEPSNADKQVRRIPRQWVHMTHPQNSDQGEVEIEIELLPMELAEKVEYKAARGFDGFKPALNGPTRVLSPPNRPDDSFPWYRLDLQLLWRCKYMWKKARWYVLGMVLCALAGIVALAYLKSQSFI